MKFLALVILLTFANAFAGPIAGVPNDLRRQFKSLSKFEKQEIQFMGQKISSLLSPRHHQPVVYFDIPKSIEADVMDKIILKNLPNKVRMEYSRDLEDNGIEYQLYLEDKKIDGGWIEVYPVAGDKTAIGVKAPITDNILSFTDNKGGDLFLDDGHLVEFRVLQSGELQEIFFAEGSTLPKRLKMNISAKKDEEAKVEKIKLQTGTFPDQIVFDKKNNIWFTQPSDNLLTRFDPQTLTWENIKVGPSPDGLWIDRLGKLWFGEYTGKHLGMYDPATKKYQQFEVPYSPANPAIPYEDQNGLIWLSDHSSDRVSVFDPVKLTWETYKTPKAGAWIVHLFQLPNGNPDIFGTHCYSNAIGHVDYSTRVYTEIPLGVSTCPAFASSVEDSIYSTLWSGSSVMVLNTKTSEISELAIQNNSWTEKGTGPIGKDSKGNLFFASLGGGRAYKYNTTTKELLYAEGIGSTKDGLVVDPNGTAWITETGDKLVKVTFSK